jgi:hypothetical protein
MLLYYFIPFQNHLHSIHDFVCLYSDISRNIQWKAQNVTHVKQENLTSYKHRINKSFKQNVPQKTKQHPAVSYR